MIRFLLEFGIFVIRDENFKKMFKNDALVSGSKSNRFFKEIVDSIKKLFQNSFINVPTLIVMT